MLGRAQSCSVDKRFVAVRSLTLQIEVSRFLFSLICPAAPYSGSSSSWSIFEAVVSRRRGTEFFRTWDRVFSVWDSLDLVISHFISTCVFNVIVLIRMACSQASGDQEWEKRRSWMKRGWVLTAVVMNNSPLEMLFALPGRCSTSIQRISITSLLKREVSTIIPTNSTFIPEYKIQTYQRVVFASPVTLPEEPSTPTSIHPSRWSWRATISCKNILMLFSLPLNKERTAPIVLFVRKTESWMASYWHLDAVAWSLNVCASRQIAIKDPEDSMYK